MSQTILSGNFTVYFTNDTGGDKQIRYTGSGSVYSVNAVYSALMDLFDNNTAGVGDYMDEGIPVKAVTPTQYLIGRLETNDGEPWFIDPETVKYLKGGSIDTVGWTRNVGTDIGVVRITYTIGTDFSTSDLGKVVVSSAGDSGRLLYYDGIYAWIRPDSNAAGDNFDSGTVTVTAGSSASVTITADDTGEIVWANVYTLGSIQSNTRLYLAQNNTELVNWWDEGHFDILVSISEFGSLIDYGYLTVYARQFTKLYDYFVIDVSGGGRNAVPLATSADTNNLNGYRTVAVTGTTIAFTEGGLVTCSNGARVVVTKNTGTPSTSIEYYLVGDTTIDLADTETLTDQATLTVNGSVSGSPSSIFAATYSDVTVTFGIDNTFDIDDDSTNEYYSIVIDCNSRPLSQVYERLKYITRRGETTITLNGIEGQQYIGIDHVLTYISLTGTISTGDTVFQETATSSGLYTYGEVVAHDTTNKQLYIRDTRGANDWKSFIGAENAQVDGSNYVTMEGIGEEYVLSIQPTKVAPFGTLAGGRFFGAFGVVLDNVAVADINNYEVIANDGNSYEEPIQVATVITVVDAATQLPIENARVILGASDATGDLGFEDSVTITRVSSTATVAHTSHPYIVGSKVNISGANQIEYNGVKTITGITANSYDYTVTGTPTTPATGTITSTGLILEGLTDVNGQISDVRSISTDQPIIGRARRSTTSPLYKTSTISGTVDSVTGYSQTVSLIKDEN